MRPEVRPEPPDAGRTLRPAPRAGFGPDGPAPDLLADALALDAALYARAQRRLGRLCAVTAVVFGFGLILTVGMYAADSLDARQLWLNLFGNAALLAFSFAIERRMRGAPVAPGRLAAVQSTFEVSVALFISIGTPDFVYATTGKPPVMSLSSAMILLFPLVVPLPPRRTFWTAVAAAAMSPLGLAILHALGGVRPAPIDYFTVSVIPALAVVMAVLSSRVVHGLTAEVSAALQMGTYRLVEKIGEGGMGEVWRGDHVRLARPAAIKLIRTGQPPSRGATAQARVVERFEREAQVTASLQSPHTVELYDFGATEDGTVYYVMELLQGYDLEALVTRFGPLPAGRVIHLLRPICESLAEAHRAGLVHRDIKPANLHVGRRGVRDDFVKVLDFGLVALRSEDPGEGIPVGTPAYMAPEATGGAVDARSDLYSLGCVGWFLLTGAPPYAGTNALGLMLAHCNEPVPSLGADPPGPLEIVLRRCLAKAPEERYPDALALGEALAKAAAAAPPWAPADAAAWWTKNAPAERDPRRTPAQILTPQQGQRLPGSPAHPGPLQSR